MGVIKPARPTVTHEGRIFDRWEPAPDRGTWKRAWIGLVTLTVRSGTPETTAAEMRTVPGEMAAGSAIIRAMVADGTLRGDPARVELGLHRSDPVVTWDGDRVTYRQVMEVVQDFTPAPTDAEYREGWRRLTGRYPLTVRDIVAGLDAMAAARGPQNSAQSRQLALFGGD